MMPKLKDMPAMPDTSDFKVAWGSTLEVVPKLTHEDGRYVARFVDQRVSVCVHRDFREAVEWCQAEATAGWIPVAEFAGWSYLPGIIERAKQAVESRLPF